MNEYMTADQVCQMLHISKRKCAWMLQNGLLPCKNTGKKTRQYRIRSEDVIAYQTKNAGCPDVLPKIFSSASPRQPRVPPADFCERLSKTWFDLPDALTEQDVARLLGYTANTVDVVWFKRQILTKNPWRNNIADSAKTCRSVIWENHSITGKYR